QHSYRVSPSHSRASMLRRTLCTFELLSCTFELLRLERNRWALTTPILLQGSTT
ncbi:unnamed protein product, partial [Laminaria digitata]